MPSAIKQSQVILNNGNDILWQGRPIFRKPELKEFLLYFYVIAAAILIVIIFLIQKEYELAFIIGFPLCFIGLMGVLNLLIFNKKKLKKTLYTIRNDRITIYYGKHILSELYFCDMKEIILELNGSHSEGTILFKNNINPVKKSLDTEFRNISDVANAYNLSKKLLNGGNGYAGRN